MVAADAPKILGIGNLHHFIFLDNSNKKRHVLFFVSIVFNSDEFSGVRYLALTLKEFKNAKLSKVEKISCDKNLDLGDIHITGKSQKVTVMNGGYLETVKLTNSTINRAMARGKKLTSKINTVFNGNTNDFIVRYQGTTQCGARHVMHMSATTPKYSVVYYPENPNIGLCDKSLNSRTAFPCAVVTIAESDDFDRVICKSNREGRKSCGCPWYVRLWDYIKRLFIKK